ncbi:MAG: hypothetical protein HKN25_16650 [Pyrinomonadaceae bacterium]|nr:hypothetical protein [Pyrinomonadaceae bacterium]
MQSNAAKKILPIISEDKKLEVSLEEGKAIMKLLTWSDDLGWCGQKTLEIDDSMLDDLHRVIAAARLKTNREKNETNEVVSNKVIEFPGI